MRYYIIAGEASGDMHGSNLMKGLLTADPECDFRFWGGDMMAEVAGKMVRHYKDTAVMGFVEVLMNLGKISENFRLCRQDLLSYRPDVIVLIDYPGFNLKMARFAKEHGIKVFYYISPKVWAWKEGRVKQLKKYVDKLFIIFPFEVEYFKRKGIDAIYCGNPLIDRISSNRCSTETRQDFLKRHSLPDKPSIALLAGSRKMEIDFLLPKMVKAAGQFQDRYQLLLAAAPSIDLSHYRRYTDGSPIIIIENDTYSVLKHSEAAVISSGTASLEAAIIGTPQVVCYGGNAISIMLAKAFIKIPTISLANIILGRIIFKEMVQNDCTPHTIAAELTRLLTDPDYIQKMKSDYAQLHATLGGEGASVKVAKAMVAELNTISTPLK